jgi:4-diphosphocytidyl-2-C-methyl-D-erythritol kinase
VITFVYWQLNLLTVLLFPNAKINIGLNVLYKRQDGYHELETIFYPVPLCDALEISPAQSPKFSSSGISIPAGKNLCQKAYDLLAQDFNLTPVHIHLHKNIPIGAGLGGGSADAAFTLLGLDKMFELGLSNKQLKQYALQLGADCPFFIDNKACLATGIGEELTPIDLDLSDYKLVLVKPNVSVSTAQAYAGVKPSNQGTALKDLIAQPMPEWSLKNDFESSVFSAHPELQEIKQELIRKGAVYTSMSGSGSTIYAFFKEVPKINFKKASVFTF